MVMNRETGSGYGLFHGIIPEVLNVVVKLVQLLFNS